MGERSHPPSLVRSAERLVRDERLFGRGNLVLCACSGGPDSTALLHVLALLTAVGHALVAHGVDHGLRPEAGAELSAFAGAVAGPLGVPFSVTRVGVAPGANLQARARAARHEALAKAADAAGAQGRGHRAHRGRPGGDLPPPAPPGIGPPRARRPPRNRPASCRGR